MSSKLLAESYAKDVLAGKLVANKLVSLACRNFLDNLQQQNDDDFEWQFDPTEPLKFIEFIENLVQKNGNRINLQPWQHFIIGNLLGWTSKKTGLRRYREFIDTTGRLTGFTTLMSDLLIYDSHTASDKHFNFFVGLTSKLADIFFAGLKEIACQNKTLSTARAYDTKYLDNGVINTSFSYQYVRNRDYSTFDGLKVKYAVFDDAGIVFDKKIIKALKQAMVPVENSMLIYHVNAGRPFNNGFQEKINRAIDDLNDHKDTRRFYFLAGLDESDIDHINFENAAKLRPNLPYNDPRAWEEPYFWGFPYTREYYRQAVIKKRQVKAVK